MPRTRSSLVFAALLGLFFLSIYLLSESSDLQHNGDTYLRYQTTQAIVDHHRLWLAHPLWVDARVAKGVGGHLYAFYAPGQAVFMIPLYIAGKVVAHHFSLPYDITTLYASRSLDLFLGAALAVLFFLMSLAIGYSPRVSAVLTLMFGLATAAWPDAQSALEQTQVDLMLLAAVYGAFAFVTGRLRRRRWLVLAGTFAGLALFTRYDAALYLPIVLLYPLAVRFTRERFSVSTFAVDIAAYGLGATPWLLLVAWWNIARFGSPFLTGLHEQTFGEPVLQGLLNLILSPGKGLIWYLPLVFLLPAAAPRFYRRNRPLCLFFGALSVVPLLFYANVLYWHGDPAWGPRYLYAALPYLILPLGEILASWQRRSLTLKGAFVALVGVSLVIQVAAVSVTQWRYWYRLEVMQQQAANLNAWSGQPFQWGAQHYHYYWNVREAPIPVQIDNVYQVLRLYLGDEAYRFSRWPDPWVSNPVDNYPVNSLTFWWADTRHPLFGTTTRAILALALALLALVTLCVLLYLLAARTRKQAVDGRQPELGFSPLHSAGP